MDPGVIGVFIPIVAIVMGIGIGMLAIWAEHKRKAQILEQNHRERMHAIEKGIELPPLPTNLVSQGNGPATSSPERALRAGIMMTLIGVAITVAWAYSVAVTFGLPGMDFYWEMATLIDIMLIGHYLEMKSAARG